VRMIHDVPGHPAHGKDETERTDHSVDPASTPLTQEMLRDQAMRRIQTARPEMSEMSISDLNRLQQHLTEDSDTLVCCVIRRLDLASFVEGACTFAAGLAPDQHPAWRRSFTKTIFLAGNPENLDTRFRFQHITPDRSAAWTPPSTPDELTALRRLLKAFDGPHALPASQPTVTLPGTPGPARDLYLATAGVTVADTAVHLNHLLAEATLDGLLHPGDRLAVRQVPRLLGITEPFAALRIAIDPADPTRLRAFAGLTKESGHA